MVIVKIIGGLGNQMFQYAYAKALQSKGYDVKIDISGFETYNLHGGYQLDKYNTNIAIATKNELENFKISNTLLSRVFRKLGFDNKKIINEKSLSFTQENLKPLDGTYINGYFQSSKYFNEIKTELSNDFKINFDLTNYTLEIEKEIQESNTPISLHIRRGDYTNSNTVSVHGLCSLDYYEKAINLLNEKFNDIKFFVFSDDIEWTKNNLKIKNATYLDSAELRLPHEDMYLMSLCKHNIIANSTFSWWGGWLNSNIDKIVIAPKQWFADSKLQEQIKDIYVESWIKL